MEFYEWYNIISAFGSGTSFFWISIAVAIGIYAVCLALGGFGLYTMAKKENIKHAWLAFVPFANTYFASKIAGEVSLFGAKTKHGGLIAALAEFIYIGLSIFLLVMMYFVTPWIEGVNELGKIVMRPDFPVSLRWMISGINVTSLVSSIFSIVQWVFFFMVYLGVFRKYYARNPILMTILSAIFPLRGIVLFAVRNNEPVDYNEYMRRRMERYASQQQGYGNPYGGTPNQGASQEDPFGGEFGSNQPSGMGADPFGGEFGGRGAQPPQADPFGDEFSPNTSDTKKDE